MEWVDAAAGVGDSLSLTLGEQNQTTLGCVSIPAFTVSKSRSNLEVQQEGISLVNYGASRHAAFYSPQRRLFDTRVGLREDCEVRPGHTCSTMTIGLPPEQSMC